MWTGSGACRTTCPLSQDLQLGAVRVEGASFAPITGTSGMAETLSEIHSKYEELKHWR